MLDENEVKKKTFLNNKYIERMRGKITLYDDDPNAEIRHEKHLCKVCFYMKADSWAGQAFTNKDCESCGKTMTFATTDTDVVCKECAEKYNVCKHCGAKMD